MATLSTNIRSGTGILSGAASNVVATLGASAAVGELVVVLLSAAAATKTFTVTDNFTGGPNTWTVIPIQGASGSSAALAYSVLTAAGANGNTVTGTISSGTPGGRAFDIIKYPTSAFTGSVDAHTLSNDVISGSAAPGPVAFGATLGNANNIVVCAGWLRNSTGSGSLTQDATWNNVSIIDHTGTTSHHQFIADLNDTSANNPSISPTSATSTDTWGFGMVAFVAPGGGGGTVSHNLGLLGVGA